MLRSKLHLLIVNIQRKKQNQQNTKNQTLKQPPNPHTLLITFT